MKTIFLHGLGQSARDWQPVTAQLDCAPGEADCPELFSWAEPRIRDTNTRRSRPNSLSGTSMK